MAAPSEFSAQTGSVEVWARRAGANYNSVDAYSLDSSFRANSVSIGTRSRPSTASLSFNRARVIRGEVLEPNVLTSALFSVVWKQSASAVPLVLFEGIPNARERRISGGAVGDDAFELTLVSAVQLWDQYAAPGGSMFCGGRFILGPGGVGSNYIAAHDAGMPLVFNAGGRPNRSIRTLADTPIVQYIGPQIAPDVHYFTADDGVDYYNPGAGTGIDTERRIREARYWTYAQILAYLLAMHGTATAAAPVVRNNVSVWFGSPPGVTATTTPRLQPEHSTLWGALIGRTPSNLNPAAANYLYKREAKSVFYEDQTVVGPPYVSFSISPSSLLCQKAVEINCEGLSLFDAIALVLHHAGLGWFIESYQPFANLTAFPPAVVHAVRVWTPGGELLNDGGEAGIGATYQPKLQPWGTAPDNTAAAILTKNNVESLAASFDSSRIVNYPIIKRGPTRYEITALLRPGWEICKSATLFLLDNISPTTNFSGDPAPVTPKIELQVAETDARYSLWPGVYRNANFDQMTPYTNARINNLYNCLHANGATFAAFKHVLRKWILPTDTRYINSTLYPRDTATLAAAGMPWYFGTYAPVDFSAAPASGPTFPPVLLNPIPGAGGWPLRPRPLGPCLVSDPNGASLGVRVELSFDSGTTWFEFPSFSALPDECGVMLNFQNPFEVINPTLVNPLAADPNLANNLLFAYLRHTLRVRVTGTIEGSETATDKFTTTPASFAAGTIPRGRLDYRADRYRKSVCVSKFKDRTVDNPAELDPRTLVPNPTPPPAQILNLASKALLFRPDDDSYAMLYEASRSQAMTGDPRVSGVFVHPWIEAGEDKTLWPGYVVEKLVETPSSPGNDGRMNWSVNFATATAGGGAGKLAPHIAGITYTFAAGGFRTMIMTEDWRAVAEMGMA